MQVELSELLRGHGRDAILREAEAAGLGPRGGRFRCPFEGCRDRDKERSRNVSVYVGAGGVPRVKCFRCDGGGSLLDLQVASRGWSIEEAVRTLRGAVALPTKPRLAVVREAVALDADKLSPAEVRSAWDACVNTADDDAEAYLESRGLDGAMALGCVRVAPGSARHPGVARLAKKGYRLAALCRDVTGASLGIQFRLVREARAKEPKVLSLKGSTMRGAFLGDPGAIETAHTVVVAEGIADTIAAGLWAGAKAVVVGAPGKNHLPGLAEHLEESGIEVDGRLFVLLPQNDRPQNLSRREFRRLAQLLSARGAIVVMQSSPDEYKDVAEWLRAAPDMEWPPPAVQASLDRLAADDDAHQSTGTSAPGGALPIPDRFGADQYRQDFSSLLAVLDDPYGREAVMGARELATDERTGEVLLGGSPVGERDVSLIRAGIEKTARSTEGRPLKFAVADIIAALQVVAGRKQIHPVRQWLAALEWDKVPRIDEQLPDLGLHVDDSPLAPVLLRRWMVGAVARAMAPGCKMDTVLVLVGEQGVGKSSFFGELGGKWFTDQAISLDDKDGRLILRTTWILEWSELDSMRRARDAEALKAFLSQRVDMIRPPYGRMTIEMPRGCVVVGTTNADSFLTDSTGNRRFWPVRVGSIDLSWVAANRDQLWAEALAAYRAGERWWLDRDESLALVDDARPHEANDVWAPLIEPWLVGRSETTTAEVLAGPIGRETGQWSAADGHRVAATMRRLGWTQARERRLDGTRPRVWMAPARPCSES